MILALKHAIAEKIAIVAILAVASLLVSVSLANAAERYITLASTTSTQNSGLFKYLLPKFTKAHGITVRVVAVGTGAAIRLAKNGDADVLLVHHAASEKAFVAQGYGLKRHPVMFNDFVLVGPKKDPAGLAKVTSVAKALQKIYAEKVPFLSRGDDSGTHKRERKLWRRAGLSPGGRTNQWYQEIGAGMGAALNMAAALEGYTLSDRGTWLSFKNRRDLAILLEGDPLLRNVYGIIAVAPQRHPHVKAKAGRIFIDWMLSAAGQKAIGAYRISGQVLFHPIASGK